MAPPAVWIEAVPKVADKKYTFACYRREVSAKQAQQLLRDTKYPFQRELRPWHVAEQRWLIDHGQLRVGMEVHFAVFELTGVRYQINAVHTMTALAQSGKTWQFVFIDHFVNTEEDVAKLYATFDQHLKRSWRNVYAVQPVFQAQNLPPLILDRLGGITNLLASGFRAEVQFRANEGFALLKNAVTRIALMESWLPEIQEFLLTIPAKKRGNKAYSENRGFLLRSSVLAIALVTYRFAPGLAAQFWPKIAEDSGLQLGDPQRALLYYLRTHGTRQATIPEYVRVVASAWNHFVNAHVLRELPGRSGTVRPASMPIRIEKTPHDGEWHYGYLGYDGTIYKKNPHILGRHVELTTTPDGP